MKRKIITNIPENPREIMDYALSKSYKYWIDEKGTKDNPDVWRRNPSERTYEEAYDIIQPNKPHWVISFRNNSYFGDKDYWEFGGSNISDGDYGAIFIWICVDVDVAEEIFEKFNLNVKHIN